MARLIPARQVAERYGVTLRSLDRWVADRALGFRVPVKINSRNYFNEEELAEFDRQRVQVRDAKRAKMPEVA